MMLWQCQDLQLPMHDYNKFHKSHQVGPFALNNCGHRYGFWACPPPAGRVWLQKIWAISEKKQHSDGVPVPS